MRCDIWHCAAIWQLWGGGAAQASRSHVAWLKDGRNLVPLRHRGIIEYINLEALLTLISNILK